MQEETFHRVDNELIGVIHAAISTSSCYLEALKKVIDWQTMNRDLQAFHFSAYPKSPGVSNENIAREILEVMEEHARGETEDVTGIEIM